MMTPSYTRQDIALIVLSALMSAGSFFVPIRTGENRWAGWFFAACTGVLLFAPRLRRRQERRLVQKVQFDDEVIRAISPNGRVESIRWSDLAEIGIVTTNEGPWVEDVFWVFENGDRTAGCAVANGADGFKSLLERIQRLPGFDNEQVIRAMACVSSSRFLVWRRATQQAALAGDPATAGPAA